MRTLCKALLPLFALMLPVAVTSSPVGAALTNPCHSALLGPTFSPNGAIAWCTGGGSYAADHIRVMLKCQTDTAWRYGPAVYYNDQTSGLYCPIGRLVSQASIAFYQ